jgi:hypothetical protein
MILIYFFFINLNRSQDDNDSTINKYFLLKYFFAFIYFIFDESDYINFYTLNMFYFSFELMYFVLSNQTIITCN